MLRHLRDLHYLARYGEAAPQSYERLFVDPRQIKRSYAKHKPGVPKLSRRHSGLILDGDWDLATRKLKKSPKIRACRKHFRKGLSWEETGVYDMMRRMIERRGSFDSCRTPEDVERRYQEIDALYDAIRAEGRFRSFAKRRLGVTREKGGVFVHLTRSGEPIFGMIGNHRMAIAQILKFDMIPVQLGVVHKQAFDSGAFATVRARSRAYAAEHGL
ncbi:hypothetical protein [Poseidonocella sedimentorum]|uniref:ParB-like nuclease domain-containing protein n=1 Tax=Poseidonocella sedimentorum TaxID=871652 RepID=A0A1I6E504_9RHOB|nr:hypothetical protein [Poseidonocella sedimentorum]SFR12815.1 hypothetical protein SAMN04515673_107125 [Poseidonocella sedimentorum]